VKIRTDSLHGGVAIITETDDASVTSIPADRCLYKQGLAANTRGGEFKKKNTAARLPLPKRRERKNRERHMRTYTSFLSRKTCSSISPLQPKSLFLTFYIRMAAHFKDEILYS
jgi:hypothetical protein